MEQAPRFLVVIAVTVNSPSLSRIADRHLILGGMIFCVAAGIVPLLASIALSFCSVDAASSFHLGSLEGYRALFQGGRLEELRKILLRAGTATLFTMLISVPAAYWIARLKRVETQTIVLALLITPWLVSDMLRAFGWQMLLAPDGWPVGKVWSLLTAADSPIELRYTTTAVVVGLVSAMIPAGVLSVLAAVPDPNRTEWLAAAELGKPRHVFELITLGRARPGILLGTCIVFVLSGFASAEPRFLDGRHTNQHSNHGRFVG